MLTRALFCLFIVGVANEVIAADPPPGDSIILPPSPAPVVPPVPVGAPIKLTGTLIYDVRCKVPCVVRAYPANLVSITKEEVAAGETLRVKDDFSDGAKTHSYKGAMTVYFVKALGKGAVDLVITPVGFKAESEIVTVSLDVDAGQGPQPPPGPNPPVPPTPVPVTSFHSFIIRESMATHTKEQVSVMDGVKVETWLTANCTEGKNGWRRYDPQQDTTGETPTLKALWAAVQPKLTTFPCLVIEVNGKADILPLPATPDEAVALLNKYKGGK